MSTTRFEKLMPMIHLMQARVYYEDTDFSGVVYHARYLHFLERGRTEYLRAQGFDQRALFEDSEGAIAFAVRKMVLNFLQSARMDDLITIETRVAEIGGASIHMKQRILRGEDVLFTGDVQVAHLINGRPKRLSERMSNVFGDNTIG